MGVDDKRLTPTELKKYDGTDGMPIYVAYEDRIYEVTESKLWTGGKHMGITRQAATSQRASRTHLMTEKRY